MNSGMMFVRLTPPPPEMSIAMQAPLPTGTILQQRFQVVKVLGQGGFGRTYLAEDQGRFHELCVLKEFTPQQTGVEALQKAKELFQKEAAILYRINHPQVPKFQATFEQDGRLFLVQQYIQGKTYRTLLDERLAQGQAFSEAECFWLLQQMLPVLQYLHQQNILHRDIAPDNMIRRETDGLPVLIDFGAVKDLATRFNQPFVQSVTRIGKDFYAPAEQMQLGTPDRSSDLYALAVTLVVLLTGREPGVLYDAQTQTWYWQRWASVAPNFASLLNRMLQAQPGDRFPSADAILPLLANPSMPMLPVQPVPLATAAQPTVNLVGRSPRYPTATVPPASPWLQLLQQTGGALGRSFIQLGKLLWQTFSWVVSGLLRWLSPLLRDLMKWAIVVFLLVSVVQWGWTSLVQQVQGWLPKPDKTAAPKADASPFQFPKIEFPKIELPKIELPKIELPSDPSSSMTEAQRREQLKTRLQERGIDRSCFTALVNDQFYSERPELVSKGKRYTLNPDDPNDASLRSEWLKLAEDLLNQTDSEAKCR